MSTSSTTPACETRVDEQPGLYVPKVTVVARIAVPATSPVVTSLRLVCRGDDGNAKVLAPVGKLGRRRA
jgi:hypothetical protein